MKVYLLIFGFFMFNNLFAQQVEYKADSLKENGNLKLAINEYSKIYLRSPNNSQILYKYSRALALDNQIDTAFYYLKHFVNSDTTKFLLLKLLEPDFYSLIGHKEWELIEDIVIKNNENFNNVKYTDKELTKLLWSMHIRQNAFSYHIKLAKRLNGKNSPIIAVLQKYRDRLNRKNMTLLEDIIKNKGWPKKSVVHTIASKTAFSVIYNSDYIIQKKYFEIFKEATENKEADIRDLAKLIDRINLAEGKKQIYGTQFLKNDKGMWEVKDLFEPEFVNQRRKEMGLNKIDEELFMYGIYDLLKLLREK